MAVADGQPTPGEPAQVPPETTSAGDGHPTAQGAGLGGHAHDPFLHTHVWLVTPVQLGDVAGVLGHIRPGTEHAVSCITPSLGQPGAGLPSSPSASAPLSEALAPAVCPPHATSTSSGAQSEPIARTMTSSPRERGRLAGLVPALQIPPSGPSASETLASISHDVFATTFQTPATQASASYTVVPPHDRASPPHVMP